MILALSMLMILAPAATVEAAYTQAQLDAFGNGGYTDNEIINGAISEDIATQSIVLLNNNGVLPLRDTKEIALFGNGVTATVKGGTGSGIVNQRHHAEGIFPQDRPRCGCYGIQRQLSSTGRDHHPGMDRGSSYHGHCHLCDRPKCRGRR